MRMAPADQLDDDAVARLLAEDARSASARYASQGLSALIPRRPAEAVMKPNTRFLKNLVREADSHNAALRRKEQSERQARLRQLNRSGLLRDNKHSAADEEDRHRKRRRLEGRSGREYRESHDKDDQKEQSQRHKHKRSRHSSSERSYSRSPSPHRHHHRRHHHRRNDHGYVDDEERNPKYGHKRRNTTDGRHRSRPPSPQKDHRHQNQPSSSSTSRHRTHDKMQQPRSKEPRSKESTPTGRSSTDRHDSRDDDDPASDSDPLEEILGPLPPASSVTATVSRRGRGAQKQSSSAIDSHFSANYDPSLDIFKPSDDESEQGSSAPAAEQQDWHMALEAFRDRQKLKQKHAERMREAGFTDEDIRKWQHGGGGGGVSGCRSSKVKSADNLRWGKKGEAREWDQGKSTIGR